MSTRTYTVGSTVLVGTRAAVVTAVNVQRHTITVRFDNGVTTVVSARAVVTVKLA